MNISYDQVADVLYLTFDDTKRAEYVEEAGVVLRVHPDTRAVVGCTIPRFSAQAKDGLQMPYLAGTLTADLAGFATGNKKLPA